MEYTEEYLQQIIDEYNEVIKKIYHLLQYQNYDIIEYILYNEYYDVIEVYVYSIEPYYKLRMKQLDMCEIGAEVFSKKEIKAIKDYIEVCDKLTNIIRYVYKSYLNLNVVRFYFVSNKLNLKRKLAFGTTHIVKNSQTGLHKYEHCHISPKWLSYSDEQLNRVRYKLSIIRAGIKKYNKVYSRLLSKTHLNVFD